MLARRPHRLLPVLGAVCIALVGCANGDGRPSSNQPLPMRATLVLDFAPNAIHAGTFLATERGDDRRAGLDLRVQAPSASTDAVKLLLSGRADLAYLDIHDLALADERAPGSLVAVMALVQRPLAAILAAPDVTRPRELEGRSAGVSGLPSDDAVLTSVVRGDGGDPDRVRRVTIGFQAVPALLAGRVAAATGFWNAEGIALRRRRPGTRIFRVDRFGAPSYPELVLVTTTRTLRERPKLVRAAVRTLRSGYEATIADPQAAIAALTAAAAGADARTARRELDAVLPAFSPADGAPFGTLDMRTLEDWARWERRVGITASTPTVGRLFPVLGG